MNRVLLVVLGLACAACPDKKDIKASDYDQTCTAASDCVIIFEGAVCGCDSPCPSAAINTRDEEKYKSDSNLQDCPFNPLAPSCDCGSEFDTTCVSGKCGLVEVPWGGADGGAGTDGG